MLHIGKVYAHCPDITKGVTATVCRLEKSFLTQMATSSWLSPYSFMSIPMQLEKPCMPTITSRQSISLVHQIYTSEQISGALVWSCWSWPLESQQTASRILHSRSGRPALLNSKPCCNVQAFHIVFSWSQCPLCWSTWHLHSTMQASSAARSAYPTSLGQAQRPKA